MYDWSAGTLSTLKERGENHEVRRKTCISIWRRISGIGAADLLCKVGACPVIYDGNDKQDPEAIKARLEQPENVDIILGELSEEARKTLDLVVMSPGVPTDLPIVKTLRTQGLPIWGEVELAYQMGKGKVLAITGTNGKTTTTAMLGKS